MLKIGSVINGSYKILNVIGRGGMSVVYLAMNERANKFWAVKEIVKGDWGRLALDRKEIEMLKRLKHPGIPSIVDVIEERSRLLIVMDYVEGLSLDTLLLQQGAQPQEKVLDWAKQLCRALLYLHSRKPPVIYRDLKPSNVMERPDGTVVLIDFGAAREYRAGSLKDTVSLGTWGYAAPEQYEETDQSDARTDIYCLGVMLFQLLTGESPHMLRPLSECGPGFLAGWDEIIGRCTRRRKEERYQSCAELLYALEHFQEQDRTYRENQKKKVRKFAACLLGAAFLGTAAGIFLGLEAGARRNSYEACLLAAGNSVDKEEEIENYVKAVRISPSREDAWLGLLKDGFLDDGLLTSEESSRLRAILIQYTGDGQTFEAAFRKNEKGYARFAYEAGLAYFYKFEEKENKKNAGNYLKLAAASGKLEKGQEERAGRLGRISEYYAQIGRVDEAGDSFVSFRGYWDDLVELSAGNLVEEDNERTALVMYGELAGQIISHAAEFRNDGVEMEEMLGQIEQTQRHLEQDFQDISPEMRRQLREEMEALETALRQAERVVLSAFGQESM